MHCRVRTGPAGYDGLVVGDEGSKGYVPDLSFIFSLWGRAEGVRLIAPRDNEASWLGLPTDGTGLLAWNE